MKKQNKITTQTQDIYNETQLKNSFHNQFQEMLSRQHKKQFHLIDAPNLVYNLSMIRPHSVSSMLKDKDNKQNFNSRKDKAYNSYQNQQNFKNFQQENFKRNSFSANKKGLSFINKSLSQRDKYKGIKQKLSFFIQNIQKEEDLNFSQVLEYKQIILKEFLSSITEDVKRQCKQKGEFVEFVWNNMFLLINKILSALTDKKKIIQKLDLQQTLKQHQQYQKYIQENKKKLEQTLFKSMQAETIISKLVYQLRFKKKQVKKLYSNLHSCMEKINQLKNSYIEVQTEHINLLMSSKDISREQAVLLMQKKEQIYKQTYIKVKLNQNKKYITNQIKKQLSIENNNFLNNKSLVEELKDLVKLETSDQKSAFISQMLQGFSPVSQIQKCQQVIKIEGKNSKKRSVATQMNDFFKFSTYLQCQSSQTTYSDKIQSQLICTKTTQTLNLKASTKIFQNKQIQADGDAMRIILIKKKLLIYRTLNLDFYFSERYRENIKPVLSLQPIISHIQSEFQRNSKNTQSLIPKNAQQIAQKKKISFVHKSSGKRKHEKSNSNFYNQERKSLYQDAKSISRKQKSRIIKHNKRGSQDSLNFQALIDQRPEDELLNQNMAFTANIPKTFSIKRHRSSIIAQGQNTDLIEFNQSKQHFIQKNLRNKKKQYYVIEREQILNSFKQNLNQKQIDKFNKTLPEKQAKTVFLSKTTLSNFSNLKLKKDESFNNLNRFKASFQNFSNFNGTNVSSPLIQKTIDKILKKSLIKIIPNSQNYKQCKEKSSLGSIFDMLNPLIKDVLEMMNNQSDYFKKKHCGNINIKNSYKILMLVYAKAFDMMNRKIVLQTLALPLFQTFQVMYGTLKIQDIYKKMITFIVGIVSITNNQIFKTFSFFFGLQNLAHLSTNLSDKITTADTVLFLKLLEKLSLGAKVINDIQNSYTTIQRVKQNLFNILIQQQMPQLMIQQLQMTIEGKLTDFQNFLNQKRLNQGAGYQNQTKLNLFKMARIIVQQNIKIKLNLINSFDPLFIFWNSKKATNLNKDLKKSNYSSVQKLKNKNVLKQTENQQSNQRICVYYLKKIIKCCKLNSVSFFQILKLIRQISKCQQIIQQKQIFTQENQNQKQKYESENMSRTITKNQFASIILKLNILNLQQIFLINKKEIQIYKSCQIIDQKKQQVQTQSNQIQVNIQNALNFKQNKQNLSKIQFLCKLEDQTNLLLQNILGKTAWIYHLSIFSIIPLKQKRCQH